MVRFFYVKFLSASRSPRGPDLPSPSRRKSQFSVHTLPDDGRSISRDVAGNSENSMNTTELTNTNIFKIMTIMDLPLVNLGAKFQPISFDAHRVEALCLQHT